MWRPGSGASRAVVLGVGGDLEDGADDQLDHVAHQDQDGGQDALHAVSVVAAIAALHVLAGTELGQRRSAQQRGDVVGQHLGGHVDDQSRLAQARDGLQVQPVLQAFERLLDAPTAVIQLTKCGCMTASASISDTAFRRCADLP